MKKPMFLTLVIVLLPLMTAAQEPTSRQIPLTVVTTIPDGMSITVQLELYDVATGGLPIGTPAPESHPVTSANGTISVLWGSRTAGGLSPTDFLSGSNRFLDVTDGVVSVLPAGRIPLYAMPFALNPGPQGDRGPQGDPGPPGPPGGVQTVTPADSSIDVMGPPTNPIVRIAPNGLTNAHIGDGSLSPAKVAGTAATLGANTFTGNQTVNADLRLGGAFSASSAGTFDVDAPFIPGGRLRILENGNVGIGTSAPGFKLDIAGRARLRGTSPEHAGSWLFQTDAPGGDRAFIGLASNNEVGLFGNTGAGWGLVMDTSSGNVGIGTRAPAARLNVVSAPTGASHGVIGDTNSPDGSGLFGRHFNTTGNGAGVTGNTNNNGAGVSGRSFGTFGSGVHGVGFFGVRGEANAGPINAIGVFGIQSDPIGTGAGVHGQAWSASATAGSFFNVAGGKILSGFSGNPSVEVFSVLGNGRTITRVLEITGGADLSEHFEVSGAPGTLAQGSTHDVQPGMVVAIDPENPGKLAVSAEAYNPRVAGIISGAGGINPGMVMGQSGSVADGAHPVALTGRVYCWADASNGPIRPGDLLTTSETPGHAMKVTEHPKAQGAILGKAMTALKEGRGLVLVLVTLQ